MAGKLGCIIPVLDQSKHLMARRYIRRLADGSLPPLPKTPYGREKLIPAGKWGMLLNDQVGDCVIAGIYHQIANEITAGTGIVVEATDAQAKQMYMKIAGWDGKLPPDSTDAGTDPTVAYDYWMKTGFPMPDGSLHKIMFYLVIPMAEQWDDQTMGDIQYCLAYFGGGGYCFSVPSSAMTQFDAGQPWTVVASDGGTLGGHYVYQVEQVDSDDEDCITWATAQKMTQEFLKYYGECLLFPVTQDMLNSKGLSPEGLNWVQIVADYGIIKGGGVLPPAPAVTSITISPATAIIAVGETAQLKAADNNGNDITSTCNWQSANEGMATVQQGLVTGAAPGQVKILAEDGTVSGSASLEVTQTGGRFQAGNPVAMVDGKTVTMPVPARMSDDLDAGGNRHLMIPLSTLKTITGWDPATQTATTN